MLDPKLKFQKIEVTNLQLPLVYNRIIEQLNGKKYKITKQDDAGIAFIKDTNRTSPRVQFLTHVDEGKFEFKPTANGLMITYTYYVPLLSSIIIFVIGIALAIIVNIIMFCIAVIPIYISLIQIFSLKNAAKGMMDKLFNA